MKANLQLGVRILCLMVLVIVLVGAIAFPLVFTSAVISNFLRIVEILSAAQ